MRRFVVMGGVAIAASGLACSGADPPTHVARDPALHTPPFFMYSPGDTRRPPRAVVFFFGNDVGFWRPHRHLATALGTDQFAVAGFDVRPLLHALPDARPARDSAFAARIVRLIAQARHELRGDSVPLIIAGHSLGADIAIWTAAFARPPGVVGVLAMSPGSRGHLRVSLTDIMNGPEPTGPESFSVAAAIAALPSCERVAVIRGSRDRLARADPELLAAGGERAVRFTIPFAGHSLKWLVATDVQARRALEWILDALRD